MRVIRADPGLPTLGPITHALRQHDGDMTATDARRELPLPARLLDALSGVFIVTLLCVLIFGPVRIDAVVANLSVSSLARLLVLLAASVAVRHLAWPRPPFSSAFPGCRPRPGRVGRPAPRVAAVSGHARRGAVHRCPRRPDHRVPGRRSAGPDLGE